MNSTGKAAECRHGRHMGGYLFVHLQHSVREVFGVNSQRGQTVPSRRSMNLSGWYGLTDGRQRVKLYLAMIRVFYPNETATTGVAVWLHSSSVG